MGDMDTCKHRWKDDPSADDSIYCIVCGLAGGSPTKMMARLEELEVENKELRQGYIKEGCESAKLRAENKLLVAALEMVRDADNDCHRDGLQTIPPIARAKIDQALEKHTIIELNLPW